MTGCRLRIDIAYDGTDFHGWAAQPATRTVCGTVQEALSTVLREPVRLVVAGRTDAGVHAEGQVAHCDIGTVPDTDALLGRMARFLPSDVRITAIAPALDGFDARFSAIRRHYVYRLSTAPYGVDPLEARYVVAARSRVYGRTDAGLDVTAMRRASQRLLGLHDFAAFCRRRDGATTVRELQRFDWTETGHRFTAALSADAFCWSMVRSLVGAVLAVGRGRRDIGWPSSLLQSRQRSGDIPVAPAHGLSLRAVDYPAHAELARRAEQTRAIRPAIEGCC